MERVAGSRTTNRTSWLSGLFVLAGGLALAGVSAWQDAEFAAGLWFSGVTVERATAFALIVSAGIILGSGMLVASGIRLMRGAPRRWLMLGTSLGVTAAGWLAIPLIFFPLLRPILEEDAKDPVRFRHSLHFSGDVQGDLTNARFVQTLVGPERTCGPDRRTYQLFQVRGFVGDVEATIGVTITPYNGPGTYRARHEYGAGVTGPGEAGMNVEVRGPSVNGYPSFFQTMYAFAGTITVDPGERSGTVDLTDEPLPSQRGGPRIRTRITGAWRCLLPGET